MTSPSTNSSIPSVASTDTPPYYHYWGKAQPKKDARFNQNQPQGAPYHLLVYHCLDVAAVAHHLLHDNAAIMNDLSGYLNISKDKLRPLLCFFIALHDLGKFAASFQALYQPNEDDFLIKFSKERFPYSKKHDALGYCFYRNALLNNCFGDFNFDRKTKRQFREGLTILFNCVLGHHGTPIQLEDKPVNFKKPQEVGTNYKDNIDPVNLQHANVWVADLMALFNIQLPTDQLTNELWQTYAKHISWQLSGLTMLADWLGSDTDYFSYQNKVMPLVEYWQIALDNAASCVHDKGLFRQHTPAPFVSVQHSFGFAPSPLQAWAESVTLPATPQLFVLEDVTGSGKTEAALTLVHRLMSKGDADGFYFGLPTTATSNAMFERINTFMATLYPTFKSQEDENHSTTAPSMPSLVLAHGSKNMNDTFQQLIANAPISQYDKDNEKPARQQGTDETGDTIRGQCHAWFASSNKRALLADIGVGTIDQALLAALPKKHQPLRLFGLHHKVLIFDEVHSADSYMFELLKSLLQVHLHQGGHAILLTATLSLDKREQLAKLWLDEEQLEFSTAVVEDKTQSESFPLATQVIASAASQGIAPVNEAPITSPARVARRLIVDFVHKPDEVVDYLVQAAQNKQCSVWVRNTVSDALNAYDDLVAAGVSTDDLLLFHSRFALINRKRIENEVLACFGKHSTAKQRAGKILIATQVFQESLDADADVMVSDLCPIDYLIQRAGRLHRHKRDADGNRLVDSNDDANNKSKTQISGRPEPKLMILAPEFQETPSDDKWYSTLFAKSQYVYQHTGQLWLTMRILMQQRCLDLPKDARLLIESVYSDKAQDLIPDVLEPASKADISQQNRKKYSAKDILIDWNKGYSEDSQKRWFSHESSVNSEVGTRYQEMLTCEVVVLNKATLADGNVFYAAANASSSSHSNNSSNNAPNANTNNFAIELSTLKISEKMANKLVKLTDSERETFEARYRGLEYKQLWLPSRDSQFVYDNNKGLIELA